MPKRRWLAAVPKAEVLAVCLWADDATISLIEWLGAGAGHLATLD
ncbi:hypothetical protein [Streptomyces sp. NPDC048641]